VQFGGPSLVCLESFRVGCDDTRHLSSKPRGLTSHNAVMRSANYMSSGGVSTLFVALLFSGEPIS